MAKPRNIRTEDGEIVTVTDSSRETAADSEDSDVTEVDAVGSEAADQAPVSTWSPGEGDEPAKTKKSGKAKKSGEAKKPDDAEVAEEPVALAEPEVDAATSGKPSKQDKGRSVSISLRTLSVSALIIALVAAVGVMTYLYIGANHKFDAQRQQIANNQHAEQIALDYAVRAAIMDAKDLGPWRRALVEGTTDTLGKKLTDAATAMEQILIPLQWTSTAKPLAAKVRTHENGVYIVDAFVSVLTKTVQSPQQLQSTATYAVTIDPANDWKISDVGGIGQVVGDK